MDTGEKIQLDPQIMQKVLFEKISQLQAENLQLLAGVQQLSGENDKLRATLRSSTATPPKADTE